MGGLHCHADKARVSPVSAAPLGARFVDGLMQRARNAACGKRAVGWRGVQTPARAFMYGWRAFMYACASARVRLGVRLGARSTVCVRANVVGGAGE